MEQEAEEEVEARTTGQHTCKRESSGLYRIASSGAPMRMMATFSGHLVAKVRLVPAVTMAVSGQGGACFGAQPRPAVSSSTALRCTTEPQAQVSQKLESWWWFERAQHLALGVRRERPLPGRERQSCSHRAARCTQVLAREEVVPCCRRRWRRRRRPCRCLHCACTVCVVQVLPGWLGVKRFSGLMDAGADCVALGGHRG